MKVLIDGRIYAMQSKGGINRCFTEYLNRIDCACKDIEILVHLPHPAKGVTPHGRNIQTVGSCPLSGVFRPVTRRICTRRIKAFRPDVFHSTYYRLPYWNGLTSVVTVHDFIDEKYPHPMTGNPPCFVDRKREAIEHADAVVAVSRATREDVLRYTAAEPNKVMVIHHGVSAEFASDPATELEVSQFRKRNRISAPYWLFVGRRAFYKNFDTLLRGWAMFETNTKRKSSLVVVGHDGRLEKGQIDFLISNRLEERLIVLTDVDDKTLKLAYDGAQAFIFPSLSEGFGIPLLEAMARGTPVIASDIPVFHEVAADAAAYFDPHDATALALLMAQLEDEGIRDNLIRNAHRRIKAFSWDETARKMADIYRHLAG